MNHNNLQEISLINHIKQLYNPPLSDEKAQEAQKNLVGFFKVLQKADSRLREKNEKTFINKNN